MIIKLTFENGNHTNQHQQRLFPSQILNSHNSPLKPRIAATNPIRTSHPPLPAPNPETCGLRCQSGPALARTHDSLY